MPNKGYVRSRAKENALVQEYRKKGWYATRTPGSKTSVDVLALRPAKCGRGDHYEVLFHQFKVSENRVKEVLDFRVQHIPFPANILWHLTPIKGEKWRAKERARKLRVKKKREKVFDKFFGKKKMKRVMEQK